MSKLRPNKKLRWLLLFAGTLVMMVVMAKTNAPLKTSVSPNGILDLEFAYNKTKAFPVINAWKETGNGDKIEIAKTNTWLDFFFLFFYSLFLYYSCIPIASSFNGFIFTTGRFLANGALAAGVLDMLENAGMLITLHGPVLDSITLLTFIFSIPKWILALTAVLYILIAGSILLYRKMSNRG